jgi:hypothetical protein
MKLYKTPKLKTSYLHTEWLFNAVQQIATLIVTSASPPFLFMG